MPETQPPSPGPAESSDGTPRSRPRDVYEERVRRFRLEEEGLDARFLHLSRWRMAAFLAAFGVLVVRTFGGTALRLPLLLAAGVLAGVFLVLLVIHRRVGERRDRASELRSLNLEALARMDRRWDQLPATETSRPGNEHPYAYDLDLFGRASLFRLLSTVSTGPGRRTLKAWLLAPAPPEVILRRQEAVAKLVPEVELRDELAVSGRLQDGRDDSESLREFLEWAEAAPWSLSVTGMALLAWGLPILTFTLGGLQLWGPVGGHWWALPLLAQLLVLRVFRRIPAEIARASAGEADLRSWAGPLEVLSEHDLRGALLEEIGETLTAGRFSAPEEIRKLARILHLADIRLSFFHPLLNPLFLLDLHVQRALDRWRHRVGNRVRVWIDAVGQAEALSAFAALAFDNPDWCTPRVAPATDPGEAGAIVRARELGHPLIPPGRCVRNDVEIGPPGSFLLVTGSNMSGKSTLLRAVGVNAVLAQAGGPACASDLLLPALDLRTSMRVEDSLERGLSTFMAELQRLREIVEAARSLERSGGRALLYLLDEILQGTNTAERQIAARRILRHLLDQGAIGAVTTHDLTLADAPDLKARAHMVHLRETVHEEENERPRISFDYVLRPGLATSTNALTFMELMGLGDDGEDA